MNRFQSWYSLQPVALRTLLTINVVLYLLWQVIFIHIDVVGAFVWQHLALNASIPGILFEPWQLITYSFLHLQPGFWGLLHILFNMLWLYWIGKEYEELHGPHRLFAAYVFGAIGGALLTLLLHELLPGVRAFGGLVHGASAAVLGVITTVAIRYPYKSIALFLFGVVRLIYVVIGFLALDILFMAGGSTSVSAHMGGALAGFLLAKAEMTGRDFSAWAQIFFRRGSRRRGGHRRREEETTLQRLEGWLAGRGRRAEEPARTARVHPMPTAPRADAPEEEVDRILDKISAQGYEALSDEEKRILYEASKK